MIFSQKQIAKSKKLTIGWLYPEQMSTYGDQGNIRVLKKRCAWRGIKTEIVNIDQNSTVNIFEKIDILFGGGAQDHEQKMIIDDLRKKKSAIKKLIENNIPTLLVCGAPQLFGKYYEPHIGKRIEGLGIFDIVSKHPGANKDRLIGNIIASSQWPIANSSYIVGFENHGGRTYLGSTARPFAKVLRGYGNNGEDKTEGVVYKNAIGSYFHGPLLTKNPEIADWLIQTAHEVKYSQKVKLKELDDTLEKIAKKSIAKRLGIQL